MPTPPATSIIQHVSDTAIWVAHYRALESQRPDAVFHDELASVLTGERGGKIVEAMARTQSMTRWSVVVRTVIIDQLIQKLVSEGVDTVLNLGAGLDTRPYRLPLPESLHWIEVDYPGIIEHKEKLLASHQPRVQLERIALDLASLDERRQLFARIGEKARRVLVLTEGVIPYLTEEQVTSLAADLHAVPPFQHWIGEYFSPKIYHWFKSKERMERLKNAPLRFFPADWLGVFRSQGWSPQETRYLGVEGAKIGRLPHYPWWAKLLLRISSKERVAETARFAGYIVFDRSDK